MSSNVPGKELASPLKIGLISDRPQISVYIRDLVDWAKKEPDIDLQYYILHEPGVDESRKHSKIFRMFSFLKQKGIRQTLSTLIFLALTWFENRRLQHNPLHKNHLERYNILDCGLTILKINPIVSKSGTVHEFSEEDIKKIQALNLDVILLCGTTLQGSILNIPKFGILDIHCGNNFQYRGGPEGFWEVLQGTDTTGFVIQRLTKKLDADPGFFRGLMETKGGWLLNQANIYSKSTYYFKEFLKKLANTKELPHPLPGLPYSQIPHKIPDIFNTIQYVWMRLKNRAINSVKPGSVWNVAFIHSNWRGASLYNGIELPPLPGTGLADPFIFTHDGRNYCFVEEIEIATTVGSIAVYELFETSATRLGTAIKENFHLSFPFIFEHENHILMIPESHQNRDIRLYECIDFPLQWKFKQTIMDNISAVDTFLFQKDKQWWLFTNTNQLNEPSYHHEMAIFHANSPFSEKWTPHALNPVYVDASRARNGGFFTSENKFYRVAQSQGIDNYGKSSTIYEIIELTADSYREIKIVHILPYFKKGIVGTHHFHTNDSITVFDYKN